MVHDTGLTSTGPPVRAGQVRLIESEPHSGIPCSARLFWCDSTADIVSGAEHGSRTGTHHPDLVELLDEISRGVRAVAELA